MFIYYYYSPFYVRFYVRFILHPSITLITGPKLLPSVLTRGDY